MGKIWVEVCLISARGLKRTSSFLKLQWFAVGWIDPENKYCTKIDASGNANPVWKTKFSTIVDPSDDETKFRDLALHVEVYSREPIFLRQSLLGSATVVLKEFFDKYDAKSDVPKPVEEVGSFQIRKRNSNKPLGFVDVSIRVSEEREEAGSSSIGMNIVELQAHKIFHSLVFCFARV
ncbi:bon1-associated protein 2 [Phtheirospermum japonicum]|uniref:Bon1-associated protein 2 n=1 Tax=Phtheirospermum japonicum TaxID=374723 RepID=A0A830BZY6_9LAMI|nr:bon1-associated protein 2 [Phtheirospermum japonicum]